MMKCPRRKVMSAILASLLAGLLFAAAEVTATEVTLYPTDDSFLDEIQPNTNHGSGSWLIARRGGTNHKLDVVVKFDLSSIPFEASVTSATLYLYYDHSADGSPAGKSLPSHQITGNWNEGTVTWNNQPGHNTAVLSSATVPVTTGTWMEWDVTNSVQDIVDGIEANEGWLIEDTSSAGAFPMIYYQSKENSLDPYLVVDYEEPQPRWEGPTEISGEATGWIYPMCAVENEYVYAVWRDMGATTLKYRRSANNGTNWDQVQTLDQGVVYEPRIAATGQYVHVVWRGPANRIKYRHSTDYGATFESMAELSNDATDGYNPDIAAAGVYVYVTWIKEDPSYDVLEKHSTNNGLLWGTTSYLTEDGGTTVEQCPRVAASAGNAHVFWLYDDAGASATKCRLRRSTDGGSNWMAEEAVWQESLGDFSHLSTSALGENLYVDRDALDGTPVKGPAQRKSTDGGSAFFSEEFLGSGNIEGPEVDASAYYPDNGANVYIQEGGELMVSIGPLCCEERVGPVNGSSTTADIGASDQGNMHVVCSSRDDAYRIYYYRHLAPAGTPDTTSLTPVEDAHVNDTDPGSNYGSSNWLYIGDQNGNEPPQTCRAYLKFDLSSLSPGTEVHWARVYLKSANTGGNGIDVCAHFQSSDAWSEEHLTWNNQPGYSGTPSDERHADHTWNCWDVTGDVQNSLNGDGVYSVVLKGVNEPDGGSWVGCHSREETNEEYRPYLEICYESEEICDCMPGDADGNAIINISDAVYLIAFIFAPPSPPPTPYPLCSGDADCNCIVNISDVVYLISFIFGGGPAPCSCQQWLANCGPPLR